MNKMPEDILLEFRSKYPTVLSSLLLDNIIPQLGKYVTILEKWRKTYNLVSVENQQQIIEDHILDCLMIAPYLKGKTFIDVGSGAGFPGMVLAISQHESSFVLLDSREKRTRFLKEVVYQCGLKNVTVVNARVEAFQSEGKFEGILTRAFSSLSEMISQTHHLLRSGGRFYAMKAHVEEDEKTAVPKEYYIQETIPLQFPWQNKTRQLLCLAANSSAGAPL